MTECQEFDGAKAMRELHQELMGGVLAWYVLDGPNPVRVYDWDVWAADMDRRHSALAQTYGDGWCVATLFCSVIRLDRVPGPFETFIWQPNPQTERLGLPDCLAPMLHDYGRRLDAYATWVESMRGHRYWSARAQDEGRKLLGLSKHWIPADSPMSNTLGHISNDLV